MNSKILTRICLGIGCILSSCAGQKAAIEGKSTATSGWVVGDFHEHSHFSDGGMKLDSVFEYSTKHFYPNFMVNTDHGGVYPRNWDGKNWSDIPGTIIKGKDPGVDKNGKLQMWRWQELLEYSYPRVAAFRNKYPFRHYIQGLEWNSPGTSDTSTGIIADSGLPISIFEYQFDHADRDTSGGPVKGLIKMNGRKDGNGERLSKPERTLATSAAIQWLMKNHRYSSWALIAHPERGGNVKIEDMRNINNAGPDVAFGFEGIPGHQKNTLRAIFYPQNAMGGGTYGGVGYMAAKVGGLWDALLAEGRRYWLFTSSDFHGTQSDFWPAEYHKTWIHAADSTSALSVLAGMRAGKVFVTNGDIINKLDFQAANPEGKVASMGETLITKSGKDVNVRIRFASPAKNHHGDSPKVKYIQLITGKVTGMVDPSSSDYIKDVNESAAVVKIFKTGDWIEKDGWNEINYKIANPQENFYLRIRGTNHDLNTPFETDSEGNPLPDSLAENLKIDGAEEAWADLWFYSNPIFVQIKK